MEMSTVETHTWGSKFCQENLVVLGVCRGSADGFDGYLAALFAVQMLDCPHEGTGPDQKQLLGL